MYADVCDHAVLHPWHKLSYFKNAGWEDEWIKTAERIICAEYERSHARKGDAEDGEAMGDEGAANIVSHYHGIDVEFVSQRMCFSAGDLIEHIQYYPSARKANTVQIAGRAYCLS